MTPVASGLSRRCHQRSARRNVDERTHSTTPRPASLVSPATRSSSRLKPALSMSTPPSPFATRSGPRSGTRDAVSLYATALRTRLAKRVAAGSDVEPMVQPYCLVRGEVGRGGDGTRRTSSSWKRRHLLVSLHRPLFLCAQRTARLHTTGQHQATTTATTSNPAFQSAEVPHLPSATLPPRPPTTIQRRDAYASPDDRAYSGDG
jgi:hypothetical protein